MKKQRDIVRNHVFRCPGSAARIAVAALAVLGAAIWIGSEPVIAVDFHECASWVPCPCGFVCAAQGGSCSGYTVVSQSCQALVIQACKPNNNFDCTNGTNLVLCRQFAWWTLDNCGGTVACTQDDKQLECMGQQQRGGGGGGTPYP